MAKNSGEKTHDENHRQTLAHLGRSDHLVDLSCAEVGPAGQTLWDGIMSEYGIADIGGLELLRQACAAQDRVASIRAAIDHAGEGISCARVGGRLEGDACSSKQPSAPPISLVAGPSSFVWQGYFMRWRSPLGAGAAVCDDAAALLVPVAARRRIPSSS